MNVAIPLGWGQVRTITPLLSAAQAVLLHESGDADADRLFGSAR